MPDATPNPCQFPSPVGPHPANFSVTFEGQPIAGRKPGPGLTWSEGLCRSCVQARTDQVRAEGGHVVDCREVNGQGAEA